MFNKATSTQILTGFTNNDPKALKHVQACIRCKHVCMVVVSRGCDIFLCSKHVVHLGFIVHSCECSIFFFPKVEMFMAKCGSYQRETSVQVLFSNPMIDRISFDGQSAPPLTVIESFPRWIGPTGGN